MNHADALKLLFPLELTGVFKTDIELEGKQLDDAQSSAETLLREMIPQSAGLTIEDWERVTGVTPDTGDSLQARQLRVINKFRATGNLSLPYFQSLAETMGYVCTIEELLADTDGYGAEGIFRWRITFYSALIIHFRAGQSCAGDYLVYGPVASALEGLFTDLKPAHTMVIFAYA